jgi:hypothetical protein
MIVIPRGRHWLVIAITVCVTALNACTAQDPGESAARIQIQHDQLVALLRTRLVTETTLSKEISRLEAEYGDVEAQTLYQGIDLSQRQGIDTVRLRIKAFDAKTDEFAAAQKQYWATWEWEVRNAELDEPFRTEFQNRFLAAQPKIVANYSAWHKGLRGTSSATAVLVDLAEQHLGRLTWRDGKLHATDAQIASELDIAQKNLADVERRTDLAGRAASASRDPSSLFIKNELHRLEQPSGP